VTLCATCNTLPPVDGLDCSLCAKKRRKRELAAAGQRRRRAENGLPPGWNQEAAAQMARMRERRAAQGLTCRGVAPKPCMSCAGPRVPGERSIYCGPCREKRKAADAKRSADYAAAQAERERLRAKRRTLPQRPRPDTTVPGVEPPSLPSRRTCELCFAIIRGGYRCRRCA
jgi:hypothetical protein